MLTPDEQVQKRMTRIEDRLRFGKEPLYDWILDYNIKELLEELQPLLKSIQN